jgi:hypothetical protein
MSSSGRNSCTTLVGLIGVDPPKVKGGSASPISAPSPSLDGQECLSSSFLQFKGLTRQPLSLPVIYFLIQKLSKNQAHAFDIASVLVYR